MLTDDWRDVACSWHNDELGTRALIPRLTDRTPRIVTPRNPDSPSRRKLALQRIEQHLARAARR